MTTRSTYTNMKDRGGSALRSIVAALVTLRDDLAVPTLSAIPARAVWLLAPSAAVWLPYGCLSRLRRVIKRKVCVLTGQYEATDSIQR